MVFFVKQKTAYEIRISYCSSDVCSSGLKKIGVRVLSLKGPPTMKLLHLPVLAAICVASPGIASAVTIPSSAQLASALKAAKWGETFDLAPGNYGALLIQSRRFSTPVTFRSLDPSTPAVFSGQSVVRN